MGLIYETLKVRLKRLLTCAQMDCVCVCLLHLRVVDVVVAGGGVVDSLCGCCSLALSAAASVCKIACVYAFAVFFEQIARSASLLHFFVQASSAMVLYTLCVSSLTCSGAVEPVLGEYDQATKLFSGFPTPHPLM